MIELHNSVSVVKGVGPVVATALQRIGIRTVDDLLQLRPKRFTDFSKPTSISESMPGPITITGTIESVNGRYVRRGMHITTAVLRDDSGSVTLTWFNQPYRAAAIKPDTKYVAQGTLELKRGRLQVTNAALELESRTKQMGLKPTYRETKELNSRKLHSFIVSALDNLAHVSETLPQEIVDSYELCDRHHALLQLHKPKTMADFEQACERFDFEVAYRYILASQLLKQDIQRSVAAPIPVDEDLLKSFVSSLPFELTEDQRAVSWQIIKDMQREMPMNRLVEGDVGSGKTVVASIAAVQAVAAGHQVALLAPTEVLAQQHAENMRKMLMSHNIRIAVLSGGKKASEKSEIKQQIAGGEIDLVIATHAVLEQDVTFMQLRLVVIDEQHRFGVRQRQELQQRDDIVPHMLSLTATPIPRTLALTVFGELDISVIKQKPASRQPIETSLSDFASIPKVYDLIRSEAKQGNQTFIICPLVEQSEAIAAKSAVGEYERLRIGPLKDLRLGVLHGRMKSAEKTEVMQRMKDKELDVLVSTTVIEVGVDIKDATVMLIEGAERFGLAQLHQLRGRIGRSDKQAYCIVATSADAKPSERLEAFTKTNNGFELAELDLEQRGAGEIYGLRQSGSVDVAKLPLHRPDIIAAAQRAVATTLETNIAWRDIEGLEKEVARIQAINTLN